MSEHKHIAAAGALFAILMLVAGCGGVSGPGSLGDTSAATETTPLLPFDDNASQTARWMNIADYLYSDTFQTTYTYPPDTVQLSYTTQEAPLRFTVSAPYRALKPSFCYQMKLEGPAVPYGQSAGSDFVNNELGFNGRWWCDDCNEPLTDADVLSGAHDGHVVKGYLYFDYLVADGDGSAEYTATANNSYHVTWKTSQRSPAPNDGAVRTYGVVVKKDGWAYDRTRKTKEIGLYGEWEPGRPLPGQVVLAPGIYQNVQFRLTEESFHSPHPSGGNWRTVMAATIGFEISEDQTDIHDVALADIGVPRLVKVGRTTSIPVTVNNKGTTAETPVISLADETAGISIGETSAPVAPGQSATVTFSWVASTKGDHVLKATAELPGDEDPSDNTLTEAVTVR